jgi:hypothetical protein
MKFFVLRNARLSETMNHFSRHHQRAHCLLSWTGAVRCEKSTALSLLTAILLMPIVKRIVLRTTEGSSPTTAHSPVSTIAPDWTVASRFIFSRSAKT